MHDYDLDPLTGSLPEVTAAEVLAVRADNAPADAVIALRWRDERVIVCPQSDTVDWAMREVALEVATRAEVRRRLGEAYDIGEVDELAEALTARLEALLASPAHRAGRAA